MSKIIIAIDGPAGSGKSTLAKMVAERLGFTYLDTGAMYRAITYLAIRNGIVDDEEAVSKFILGLDVTLKFENGVTRVFVNGEELTDYIRTPEVNSKVSEISAMPAVRKELVRMQQQMGKVGNIVAEGRDTTTVVFPDADVKIYLVASVDVRAERRHKEYMEKGIDIDIEEVKENLRKRDAIDSGREVSPLIKAENAIEVDTSSLSVDEEFEILIENIKKKINL
ncbi:Cytidylate kinase [hydrothermal vent metagenome]|uniref:(d)CMP kinase n=1 Tax=hydrothermal vent metagenome TaxID=652676 RepID=A0A3B1B9Q0_9ZZZZ